MRRLHLVILTSILLLASSLAGCFLLSPDDHEPSTLQLTIVAGGDESRLAKAPCADPVALLQEPVADLEATAWILRDLTPKDDTGPLDVIARTGLSISDPPVGGQREMTGLLEFSVGPASAAFYIDVELAYTGPAGREPLGEYEGDLIVLSGVVVSVDYLRIDQDLGGGNYAGEVQLRFGDDFTQVDLGPPDTDPIHFDPVTNRLTLNYRVEDVDWDGETRTVLVEMETTFGPTVIYHRRQLLPALVAGSSLPDVPIVLEPVLDESGRGTPLAVELVGEIRVGFEDGRPPSETGLLFLERTDKTCR